MRTLVEALRARGTITLDHPGDVVLPRDRFLDGLVEGASEVFADVRPLLRERLRRA